jgi:hypothetical protein
MIWNICTALMAMGSSSIELFEWSRPTVMMKRLPNNPMWSSLTIHQGALALTGMRLAHAVVKADYLIARNFALPSLGFLFQVGHILDLASHGNLRLLSSASSILNDVSQTSLAARVGQGLSLLFAQSRGYDFVGHLASNASVVAFLTTSGHERVADFLFEDRVGERMILESKATFSLQSNECSPVKRVLRKALLEQVDPWMGVVVPSANKSFAVYSCLRETGWTAPSSISFVDPPERKDDVHLELPRDWVRRHNYAGWLRVMGLPDAANRLWDTPDMPKPKSDAAEVRFRIGVLRGRKFALWMLPLPHYRRGGTGFCIGVEVEALRRVSAAIQGSSDMLLAYRPENEPDEQLSAALSIFGDGTIFGFAKDLEFAGSERFLL